MNRKTLWLALLILVIAFGAYHGLNQQAQPPQALADAQPADSVGGCPRLAVDAPPMWEGFAIEATSVRTGPGLGFPVHESGQLMTFERVYVLQACKGWLEGRVIPSRMIAQAREQLGEGRASETLTFWVPANLIRRD